MNLYQTQSTISENEERIYTVVLEGVNKWNTTNDQPLIDQLPIYMPPLIRYAVDDWVSEYERLLDRRPNTSFAEYVKTHDSELLFHFRWTLTHKAETLFRQAYKQLWDALSKEEQKALIHGLHYLVEQTTN